MQNSHYAQPMIDLPWSSEEHNLFLQGYLLYGKSWIEIAEVVRSRNAYQVCSYGNWLEHHNCLPRLPPIQNSAMPIAPKERSSVATVTKKSTADNNNNNNTIMNSGRWSTDEHDRFILGFEKYSQHGCKWSKIAEVVKTRNVAQTTWHGRSYIKLLEKNASGEKKRKATWAGDGQQLKAKKKLAATKTKEESTSKKSPPPQASEISSGGAHISKAALEAKPKASTSKIRGGKIAEDISEPFNNKTDAGGDSTLDIHPPSIKAERVGEGVVPPPVKKKIAFGENHTEQVAIESCGSSSLIKSDQDEALTAPSLSKFESSMKIPMVALGVAVSMLLVRTIIVYMGSEKGDIIDDEIIDDIRLSEQPDEL